MGLQTVLKNMIEDIQAHNKDSFSVSKRPTTRGHAGKEHSKRHLSDIKLTGLNRSHSMTSSSAHRPS